MYYSLALFHTVLPPAAENLIPLKHDFLIYCLRI